MAKKAKSVYMCAECGNEFPSWQGQCSYCGAWNSIVEQKVKPDADSDARRRTTSKATPSKLKSVGTGNYTRITSGISELDRVLGGGIVLGSMILISGEPGIGKSTLIIQSANSIALNNGTVLYVSGEESEEQVKLRADRVCENLSDNLLIFPETNIESVLAACEQTKPKFLVIDSIQTMYSEELDNTAGSITQIRACSNLLMKYAKTNNVPIFIVAHVNKSGDLAGPKTIEHMVDCVLNFVGERDRDLRILRSVKNRFGTTEEIGAFSMGQSGMTEVRDLSGTLLESSDIKEEGSVASALYEGSRPVFFEIQALVTPANVGFARRSAIGIDNNRLNMILAVLEKKVGISLLNHDVYVNVVGGLKPDGPGADLAVALAIYSSFRERTSPRRVVALGEVGLTGNLRAVRNADRIVSEAARLGYEAVILPRGNAKVSVPNADIEVVGAESLASAIKAFIGKN
ncbi:DNA repair protein RadA [Mogibacterium diversum]|mgnify:FL=1|jgi:DNA repair protein radA|uniref:DNA repair protein RadA n=1 Tax=Mogibacterium diversum TaxID=114527 RepID=A0A2S0L259_9FIRM|nr:DNA repair protein RadA [Mogibacterium diversum]AVM47376.1 DNA repair protein RadA [Mogibacterium diversum]